MAFFVLIHVSSSVCVSFNNISRPIIVVHVDGGCHNTNQVEVASDADMIAAGTMLDSVMIRKGQQARVACLFVVAFVVYDGNHKQST